MHTVYTCCATIQHIVYTCAKRRCSHPARVECCSASNTLCSLLSLCCACVWPFALVLLACLGLSCCSAFAACPLAIAFGLSWCTWYGSLMQPYDAWQDYCYGLALSSSSCPITAVQYSDLQRCTCCYQAQHCFYAGLRYKLECRLEGLCLSMFDGNCAVLGPACS